MSSWVRSGALIGARALVGELGGDLSALASAARIDEAAFDDSDFPVPTSSVVTFLETAAVRCQCETFGLQLAQRQNMSLLGPLWTLMQSATTVGEMLDDLSRYFMLHTTGVLIAVERTKSCQIWNYSLAADTGGNDRQTMELGLAILALEIRRACPRWMPERVSFRHSPPSDLRLHRKVFGANVFFNADRTALFIDGKVLTTTLGSGDAQTHHALASSFLAQRKQLPELLCTQTETVIRSLLPVTACDIAVVAKVLHVSSRSLQRHLTHQSTSFSRMLDAVRADLALKYLRQSELAVADIAEILGFSETSALTRAFSRWYGHSPRRERNHSRLPV
ncbi:MAG: AraC family transcriptional regulator [Rhodocyclaceae bacterium]|nr:AraC family transcriptional regulator [Rhodocyclaceae bacterium]MBP7080236.1 AraC family transcriptional regulator [Rhodocyclaceae bacterium]